MLDDLNLAPEEQEDLDFLHGMSKSFLLGNPMSGWGSDEEDETEDLFWNDVDWWTGESTTEVPVSVQTQVTPSEMKTFKEQEPGSPAAFRAFETATDSGDMTTGKLVHQMLKRKGSEYEWGGTTKETGFDCSGIIWRIMQRAGVKNFPRTSGEIYAHSKKIPVKKALKTPGAILWHEGHIAVSLGNGKTIEAMGEAYGVVIGEGEGRFTGGGILPETKLGGLGRKVKRAADKGKPVTTTTTTKAKARQLGAKDLNDPIPIGRGLTFATAIESLNEMEPVVHNRSVSDPTVKEMRAASKFLKLAPEKYQDLFVRAARKYNMPVGLLVLVAQKESGFDPDIVSPAGAIGIMQIMPQYHHLKDYFNAEESIFYGARYLSSLRQEYGNWREALAAYNAGGGNIQAGMGYAADLLKLWNQR